MAFASGKRSESGAQLVSAAEANYGGSSFWFGSSFTAVAGLTTYHDTLLHKSCKIFSGSFHVSSSSLGDTIDFEIVDVDGIFFPAGTVITRYVNSLFVVDGERRTLSSGQSASVEGGLYLRSIYHSTGSSDVTVCLDWQVFQ